ncbi:MAG: DUF1015 family protein [Candidatus Caldipriscus sp.]
MKKLKVFAPRNPHPVPYENLWDTLINDKEKVLRRDLDFLGEGFLLIKQEFEINGERRVRKAFVAFLNKMDYRFYPHEDFFPEGVRFYREIFNSYPYQFAPIMGLVDGGNWISSLNEGRKVGEYTANGVKTEVFFTEPLGNLPREVFIADGHHRFEAVEGDVLFALIDVKDPSLMILPTHRLLKVKISDLKGFLEGKEVELFPIRSLESLGEIIKMAQFPVILYLGGNRKPFGVIYKGERGILTEIPAYICDFYIFEGKYEVITGYYRDWREAVKKAEEGHTVALVSPTKPIDVIKVAREGMRMPRKSTDFYPKLVAGLFYVQPSTSL